MPRTRSLVVAADGELTVERDPERVSGRLLRQDDMDASYVDLADPRHLEFDYLRWARLVLHAFTARRVLHVGGAACTLARALLAEDNESRQPGLRLRVGDGRAAVAAHADGSIDAIVVDAFLGARVPRHLATGEALADCARVAPLTVVNVVDTSGWPDARAVAAGLGEAYAHVAALAGGGPRRGGNVVLFGSTTKPRYTRLESVAAADASPARLIRAPELGGVGAWRDGPDGSVTIDGRSGI
jgi:hypothetical protein